MGTRSTLGVLALASLALVVAGCSSSSSPASSAGDGGGGGGGGGGSFCSAISQADAQAILSHPITQLVDLSDVGSCVFKYSGGSQGDSLQIDIATVDPDKTAYSNLSQGAGDGGDNGDHPLTGVGDEAYWNQAVDGVSIPELSAHKGNVTCVIQPPDAPDSVCKTTPADNPLGIGINESDGAAFAQLLGKVCNDVFAAAQ